MADEPTRRWLLQMTGSSTMVPFVDLASANTNAGSASSNESSYHNGIVEHDLLIENHQQGDVTFAVELKRLESTGVAFKDTYNVEGRESSGRLTIPKLPVPAGRYRVTVNADGSRSSKLMWAVSSLENRNYERLSVRYLPDGELKVENYEI